MKRVLIKSDEFISFYEKLNQRTQKKLDWILEVVSVSDVVSSKFVKKLINFDFYELRISTDNEYRVILFTLDNENFQIAESILLLNGFTKKANSDYEKQIVIANNILKTMNDDEQD